MNAAAVLAIARKDVVDAVRNQYMLFGILFPLGVWLLFKVIMPGAGEFKLGAVAVYDTGSSTLVERLKANPIVDRVIDVRSAEELEAVVRKEAVGGLALSADFDELVAAEQTPQVTVILDGRRAGGELAAFRRLVDDLVRQAAGRPKTANIVERDVNDSSTAISAQFSFQNYTLVMLLILGLAMTGMFVVPTLLVEEKERHTLKAILCSPASYEDVVAGKAVVGLFYALLGAAVMLALNDGLRGNVLLLALAVILGALFLVEVGLLMGALFSTTSQVNTWSSVVMIILIAPTWTTGIRVPRTVEAAMQILPTYHLSQLVSLAMGGRAEADPWVAVAVLAGVSAAFFSAIVWSLRLAER